MRTEVIHQISETERQVWWFTLSSDTQTHLWLDSFNVEVKQPSQRKWRTMLHWQRLDKRGNTINDPPLPDEIIKQAKDLLKTQIDQLSVTK